MKVVIAGLSAPTQLNGVSRHAANLVRGLLSLPDPPEIHFLAGAWQSGMYAQAIGSAHPRLLIHPIPIPHRSLARLGWYYRDLPRIARRLAADVVHLGYTMPINRRAFACPTVVSLHDLYPFDIPQNFGSMKGPINRELMRHCLRNVDAIACVSGSTRGRLQQLFGPSFHRKAVTIFNPVEPAAAPPVHPQRLDHHWPFLLCVAQHRLNKNIPLAVRTFERLLRQGLVPAGTKLLVIGIPGPETARIHEQIRRPELHDSVIFLSGISEGELQWCYRNCELLLAPSIIEGFGLPVAEALLAGCPVVCSDIAAFHEVGADRCRYVRFGDDMVERYADAICEVLRQSRVAPAALPHLAPPAIARQYLALYTRLLSSPAESAFYADSPVDELDTAEAG